MSESKPMRERPMSPFMIGPYYRPQLTSMLSITHRGTGVALCGGALLFAWWLYALAAGPASYATFETLARSLVGKLVIAGFVFGLVYHMLNGIRHMLWDTGWGLDLKTTYATGYVVMVGSVAITALCLYCAFANGGA